MMVVPGTMRPEPCNSLLDAVLGPEGSHWIILESGVKTFDADAADGWRCTILSRAVRVIRAGEQELRRRCDATLCEFSTTCIVFFASRNVADIVYYRVTVNDTHAPKTIRALAWSTCVSGVFVWRETYKEHFIVDGDRIGQHHLVGW